MPSPTNTRINAANGSTRAATGGDTTSPVDVAAAGATTARGPSNSRRTNANPANINGEATGEPPPPANHANNPPPTPNTPPEDTTPEATP